MDAGLPRQLAWVDGVSLVVGSIVGSGIFASPGLVLRNVGSNSGAALLVWFLSGMLAYCGALCYVELGSRYSSAGGEVAYLKHAYQDAGLMSYLFMWTNVIMTRPLSITIICYIVGDYAVGFLARVLGFESTRTQVQFAALTAAFLTSLILAVSTQAATCVLRVTTGLKLAALSMIVCIGGWHLLTNEREYVEEISPRSTKQWLDYAPAFLTCLWAFDGWNSLNYASEELVDEGLMIKVISFSLPCITLLYMFTNLAYFAVVPLPLVVSSETIGIDFIQLTIPQMEPVLLLCICTSTFGAAVGTMFTSSRIVYSAAENGQLPRMLSRLTLNGTPMVALGFQFVLVVLFLVSGDFEFLIELFGCMAWFFYFITVLGLAKLKWQDGNNVTAQAHYRVSWFVVIPFLVVSICIVTFSIAAKPINGLISLAFVASGVPIWWMWNCKSVNTIKQQDTISQDEVELVVRGLN